ncbi:MAG: helix-turn-helix domain-containing protein [Clostridia bacterium]|nr:helix-turn-helix domain-containing protein [Clostridia bacterium]
MYLFSMEQNSLNDTFFNSAIHSDVQCPMHLHYSMEIVYVKSGVLIMNVNGVDRVIRSGQATFISVFEPHSFFTPKSSVCIVTEFSPQLVSEFYSAVKAKKLVTEVFEINGDFLRLLENLSDKSVLNILSVKAALYPLCFSLLNNCEFTNDGKEIDSIFIEAVKYIYDHYGDEKIDLSCVAKAIGVHPVYLSRVFSGNSGMGFSKYLALIRTYKAAQMLIKERKKNISEIAFSCGFGSIRSFNRQFINILGLSPSEYRQKNF